MIWEFVRVRVIWALVVRAASFRKLVAPGERLEMPPEISALLFFGT